MKTRLLLIAGARPNYMKIAPIYWAIRDSRELRESIVEELAQRCGGEREKRAVA